TKTTCVMHAPHECVRISFGVTILSSRTININQRGMGFPPFIRVCHGRTGMSPVPTIETSGETHMTTLEVRPMRVRDSFTWRGWAATGCVWLALVLAAHAALDYFTSYQQLEPHNQFAPFHPAETVNPLLGLVGSFSTPVTFPIPAPGSVGSPMPGQPTASFNALPVGERQITAYNAAILSV